MKEIIPNKSLIIRFENPSSIKFLIMEYPDKYIKGISLNYNYLTESHQRIREECIEKINILLKEYEFDTMVLEKIDKLFNSDINMYPDPYIMNNKMFIFGTHTVIIHTFNPIIKNIFTISYKDWSEQIFNKQIRYLMDRPKKYLFDLNYITPQNKNEIVENNLYSIVCFGLSLRYNLLVDKNKIKR